MELILQVDEPHSDPEQLDQSLRLLQQELTALDIQQVTFYSSGDRPVGAKGVDPVLVGALLLVLAPPVLTKILEFLHAWALRREGRVIKVKLQTEKDTSIELEIPSSLSEADIKKWVDLAQSSLSHAVKNSKNTWKK
jgi:hypothetical protein